MQGSEQHTKDNKDALSKWNLPAAIMLAQGMKQSSPNDDASTRNSIGSGQYHHHQQQQQENKDDGEHTFPRCQQTYYKGHSNLQHLLLSINHQ